MRLHSRAGGFAKGRGGRRPAGGPEIRPPPALARAPIPWAKWGPPPSAPGADALRAFETARLPVGADATAPDGTLVRLLPALDGGSLAHFELPAGAVSHAVTHRTVEEIWYFLTGSGQIWRRAGEQESVVDVAPGTAVTIPLGAAFQFRAAADAPLTFLAITMPPWPGAQEARRVEGHWTATVGAG